MLLGIQRNQGATGTETVKRGSSSIALNLSIAGPSWRRTAFDPIRCRRRRFTFYSIYLLWSPRFTFPLWSLPSYSTLQNKERSKVRMCPTQLYRTYPFENSTRFKVITIQGNWEVFSSRVWFCTEFCTTARNAASLPFIKTQTPREGNCWKQTVQCFPTSQLFAYKFLSPCRGH